MDAILLRVLQNNNFKVGALFTVMGKRYMFITGMMLECLTTGEYFMRGIDF